MDNWYPLVCYGLHSIGYQSIPCRPPFIVGTARAVDDVVTQQDPALLRARAKTTFQNQRFSIPRGQTNEAENAHLRTFIRRAIIAHRASFNRRNRPAILPPATRRSSPANSPLRRPCAPPTRAWPTPLRPSSPTTPSASTPPSGGCSPTGATTWASDPCRRILLPWPVTWQCAPGPGHHRHPAPGHFRHRQGPRVGRP